jgi:ribosomal subunit interface protein
MFNQIVGKGVRIKDWMREAVAKATEKLNKYFPPLSSDSKFIKVVIGKHPIKRYKVRLEVALPKKKLFAQDKGDKLLTTLNIAVDEMRRQLKRYRDRLRRFR